MRKGIVGKLAMATMRPGLKAITLNIQGISGCAVQQRYLEIRGAHFHASLCRSMLGQRHVLEFRNSDSSYHAHAQDSNDG